MEVSLSLQPWVRRAPVHAPRWGVHVGGMDVAVHHAVALTTSSRKSARICASPSRNAAAGDFVPLDIFSLSTTPAGEARVLPKRQAPRLT